MPICTNCGALIPPDLYYADPRKLYWKGRIYCPKDKEFLDKNLAWLKANEKKLRDLGLRVQAI